METPVSSELTFPVPPTSIPTGPFLDDDELAAAPPSPATWLCSTCGATHSVHELLAAAPEEAEQQSGATVACKCASPTLQAVYDQFGHIFLYWRNDPEILDLRDPLKVREAAWRVWKAGGMPWMPAEPRPRMQTQKKGVSRPLAKTRWSCSSQSSLSSAASDIEMCE